jgi:hypothetical protein
VKLRTKVLALASTLALVAGLAAISATSAGAALPKVDVSNETVTCNDIIGKIKFSVPLFLGGTTPNQVSLTIKTGDCSTSLGTYDASSNPGGVTIKSATTKGIIASSTNDCLGLSGLSSGFTVVDDINTSWSTVAGTPGLLQTKSTLTFTNSFGGVFGGATPTRAADDISWGSEYGLFLIGTDAAHGSTAAPGVTGAFTGGTGGADTTFDGTTAQSSGDLATQCFGITGIKGIQFGIGAFHYG